MTVRDRVAAALDALDAEPHGGKHYRAGVAHAVAAIRAVLDSRPSTADYQRARRAARAPGMCGECVTRPAAPGSAKCPTCLGRGTGPDADADADRELPAASVDDLLDLAARIAEG